MDARGGSVEPAAVRDRSAPSLAVRLRDARGLLLDARAVAPGELGLGVENPPRGPRSHLDDQAWLLLRHEGVRDAGRAVHEVPLAEGALLTVDEQHAASGQDDEVLLDVLGVVEGAEFPWLEQGDVDPDLREWRVALEVADRGPLVASAPPGLASVDHEPAPL